MKTFLFYDTETSGLNAAFDQILTFAAIRTDPDLREIERNATGVKLRPDIVPSPGAFVTHRLTPDIMDKGVDEYEAAKELHALVNRPGTVSLGYNTLGFDDEFLRFTFYRNLLDPYTHQYANQCGRMDILPMALLYRLFKPDVLSWPETDGRPTMKLEQISSVNRFPVSGKAHDAMTDVEATLFLARALYSEKSMWDYCLGFFDKAEDRRRAEALPLQVTYQDEAYPLGIMISLKFGVDVMYMAPVLGLGASSAYANQTLWLRLDREWDLSGDFKPEGADLYCIRKRYGESPVILPPLPRFWQRLSNDQHQLCEAALAGIRSNRSAFDRMVDYYREFRYPVVPDLDEDAALYQNGFFSPLEKKEINAFHVTSLNQAWPVIREFKAQRIRTLAARILFRNLPKTSLEQYPHLMTEYRMHMQRLDVETEANAPQGFRNDHLLTRHEAKRDIHRMLRELSMDDEQKSILSWLERYISDQETGGL